MVGKERCAAQSFPHCNAPSIGHLPLTSFPGKHVSLNIETETAAHQHSGENGSGLKRGAFQLPRYSSLM